MRWMRPAAVAASVLIAAGSCRSHPTRIVSTPELPEARDSARKEGGSPAWIEFPGPPADGHYFSAAVGDLNADGLQDIVAGAFEPGGVAAWLARPDDTWETAFVPLPSSEVREVVLSDLDGDGRDEIIAVSRGGIEGIQILAAPPAGPWKAPRSLSAGRKYEAVASGDLNGDGRMDLAAAKGGEGPDGGIEVLLGDGRGGFDGGFAPVSSGSFRDLILRDLDGDGNADLLAAGWGLADGVRVFLGDGRGGFIDARVLGAPGNYRGLALGDLDGDGREDLAAAMYRSGLRVFMDHRGTAEICPILEEGSFWSVVIADEDGDRQGEVYASSSNGLGILAFEHEQGCQFERLEAGLPDREVWYGLIALEKSRRLPAGLLAAGFGTGLRLFMRAGASAPPSGTAPRLAGAGEEAEDPFARGNDAFTSALGYDEYRLGVGDEVKVRIFDGSDAQEVEAIIQSDGDLFVPARGVGSIKASGISPTQLKAGILEKARVVWREPDVEVVVTGYKAHNVSLLGEIRGTARTDSGPGQYPLLGKTRVVDFVSKHGGPTEGADLNRVQLIRPSGMSSYLNLYRAIFASDQRENPILNVGDTIFVPSVALSNRKVFVLGEVHRPGLLELRENITLLEAIARAEGLTDEAVMKSVVVIRGGLTSPQLVAVNLEELLERGDMASDIELRNGDVVYVPRKFLADLKDFFSAIQPALNLIEDIFIVRELVDEN